MFLYFLIFIILAILSLVSHRKSSRDQMFFACISTVIVVCFQGFRWRTGTDWEPYYECFLKPDVYKEDFEYGYYLFNKVIRNYTDSYTIFLFIQCALIAFCQLKVAHYFNVQNGSFIMLFSFVTTPFPIRYTLAVSIFLLSYKYIVERKLYKFLFFYIIAVSMHQIVFVALPFYFFTRCFYSNVTLFATYFVSCVFGLMSEFVFSNLLQGVNLIFEYLPAFSQYKVNAYLVETESDRTIVSVILSYFNGAFFIYIFTKLRKYNFTSDNKFNVLLNLYVFGLSFGRLVIDAVPYLARAIACFSGGFIIMVLLGIISINLREKKCNNLFQQFVLFLFVVYVCVIYYNQLIYYKPVFIPYYSIFSSTTRTVVF